jgi:2-polyprenyl-3-methyl-5-hydroxy-6-metoxy-1,4-benzoquinol methylase
MSYKQRINGLGNWYQPIRFTPNLQTPSKYDIDSTIYGYNKWTKVIRRNLPKDLKGKHILELGCSSGLYSVLCAKEGAFVTAIELDKQSYEQAKLTIEIFSNMDGIDYFKQIKLLNINFMEHEWEQYDVVLALNVLYWITHPYSNLDKTEIMKTSTQLHITNLLRNIKQLSKMVVIQTDDNKYYYRLKHNQSTEFTHSKKIASYLRLNGFKDVHIDKPFNIKGLVRLLLRKKGGMAEVDLHKPLLYSRPVITARCG